MDQSGGSGALHPVHRSWRRASLSSPDADGRDVGVHGPPACARHLSRRHQPDGQDQSSAGARTGAVAPEPNRPLPVTQRSPAAGIAMHAHDKPHHMPYVHFGIMLALSFVLMFGFMYAMVDRLANVYPNFNQTYMAGLMVAPMAVLELLLMGAMYPDKNLNRIIIGASLVVLLGCWI